MDEPLTGDACLNQAMYRSAESVWNRRGWHGPEHAAWTRVLLGVGGGALALRGFREGGPRGGLFAGVGGAIAIWALAGRGRLDETRRWLADLRERRPWVRDDDHVVMDASADSFPASDSPAWTPTVGTGLRRRGAR
ncbi:MAG: hypothetical protein AB7H96_11285 [Vicinamibacterales bacterium]